MQQITFPAGKGQFDIRHVIKPNGELNKSSNAGRPYEAITPDQIAQMAANPPSVDKEDAWWFMPVQGQDCNSRLSTYLKEYGWYRAFPIDMDEGNLSLEATTGLLNQVLGCGYILYSTRSATSDHRKWRVIVFLDQSVHSYYYTAFCKSIYEQLEEYTPVDWSSSRLTQVAYLPNRGAHYEYYIHQGPAFQFVLTDRVVELASPPPTFVKSSATSKTGVIDSFNETFDLESMLTWCGYSYNGKDWASPYQTLRS